MQFIVVFLSCLFVIIKLEFIFGAIQLQNENLSPLLINNTLLIHPKKWQEHWKGHNEELDLVYSDKFIAFYFDPSMYPLTEIPFNILSDAWRYATETYGPFVSTPGVEASSYSLNGTLHFVLHKSRNLGCRLSNLDSYLDPQFDYRLTVDCGNISWSNVLAFLMKEIGKMIQLLAKATGNYPGQAVSNLNMYRILVYDIFVGIGRNEDARNWLESQLVMSSSEEYSKRETLWCRDWFYPIYLKYGGTSVLNHFFDTLASHWRRKENGRDYEGQMNLGEFIHFWSGAAGDDLNGLAAQAFGWTTEDSVQLENARRQYPQLNYSSDTENLFLPPDTWNVPHSMENTLRNEVYLSYFDEHVAFYTNLNLANRTLNNKPFSLPLPHKFLSEGWKYSKAKYGPFGPDPILYIIIRNFDLNTESVNCTFSKRSSYFDTVYDNRNVIDCHIYLSILSKSSSEIYQLLVHQIMEIMGGTVLRNYGETGNWPAQKISGWIFQKILTYDIFLGEGVSNTSTSLSIAFNWLQKNLVDNNEKLFRDWYFPVYKKFGRDVVLKNFLSLLHSIWPKKEHNYVREMKLGEFVHLWNGAAGINLWYLAAKAFGWNIQNHGHYFKAILDYPLLIYPDTYPNTTMPIPSITWKENWNGQKEQRFEQSGDKENWEEHREELTLAYIDEYVAVYFDSQVEASVTWPFKPLSDAWKYVQETYGPFGPDPVLYIVLHEGSHSGCISIRLDVPDENSLLNITGNMFSHRTIIDCGLSYGGWSTPRFLHQLMYKIAVITQRGAKQVGNCPMKTVGGWTNILLYDIYLGTRRTEDAVNMLRTVPAIRSLYYPMYANYGRSKIFNSLFALLQKHWPKGENGCGYTKQLNTGEFMLFWHGAIGVNLKHFFVSSGYWHDKFERQLQNAKKKYPFIKFNESAAEEIKFMNPLLLEENKTWFGHDELLFLDYEDKQIAVYGDVDFHQVVNWPFALLSQTWRQIQNAYELTYQSSNTNVILPKPFLHIILHERRSHSKCEVSWVESKTKTKQKINLTHVIDCGRGLNGWANVSQENKDTLMEGLGSIILKSAFLKANSKHSGANANMSMNNNNNRKVYLESPQIEQIIVYDIYLRDGKFKDALLWLLKCIHHVDTQSEKEILWMRNWYLPIYTSYGGVALFDKYLSILSNDGSALIENRAEGNNFVLNIGEIVHLWSVAVGINLIQKAAFAFGWAERQQNQFNEARNKLGNPRYSCYNCGLGGKEPQNAFRIGFSITVAIVIVITFLILFLWHRRKIRKLEKQIRQLTSEEIKEFFEGTSKSNDNVNDESAPLSPESVPFNKDFEIPRNKLFVDSNKVLGSGEFGLVLYGTFEETPVAVKTVKSDVDIISFKTLLSELKVICFLGRHDNIASIVGAVTENIQNSLEFCANGDFHGYMREHRQDFKDLRNQIETDKKGTASVDTPNYSNMTNNEDNKNMLSCNANKYYSNVRMDSTGVSSEASIELETSHHNYTNFAISTLNLIEWAIQISQGMDYISSKKVIHGDLAARNVLLSADKAAKISDFGLSRQLANYTNYMKKSQTPLPWRWMAIESLRDMNFSVESDVWSYGVILYEIFTLGTTPYPGYNWNPEFIGQLVGGLRLKAPEFGTDDVFHLMMDCMKEEPSKRIKFHQIGERLQKIKSNFSLANSAK